MTGRRLRIHIRPDTVHHNVSCSSLFARLSPKIAQSLHIEALQKHLDDETTCTTLLTDRTSTSTYVNGWKVSNPSEKIDGAKGNATSSSLCASGVEFLPLALTFSTGDTIYVSYNGGSIADNEADDSSTIELPPSVLPNPTYDGQVVVQPLASIQDASSLQVEPLTCGDWELLETNSDFLESGGLLQQVSVVFPNQVLPLWIGGHDVVHVRVLAVSFGATKTQHEEKEDYDSSSDSEDEDIEYTPLSCCLRLVADTEVIVTPKPRSSSRKRTSKPSTSKPLRVHPTWEDWSLPMKELCSEKPAQVGSYIHVPPLSLYAHSDTLKESVPGWKEFSSTYVPTSNKGNTLCVLWKSRHDENVEESEQEILTNEDGATKMTVVEVSASDDVPYGHVALHQLVRYHIDVTPLYDKVRLRVLTDEEIKSVPNRVHGLCDEGKMGITFQKVIVRSEHQSLKTWNFPSATDCPFATISKGDYTKRSQDEVNKSLSRIRSFLSSLVSPPGIYAALPIAQDSLVSMPLDDMSDDTSEIPVYRIKFHSHHPVMPLFILAKDLPALLLLSRSTSMGPTPPDHLHMNLSAPPGDIFNQDTPITRNVQIFKPHNEKFLNVLPPSRQLPSRCDDEGDATACRYNVGSFQTTVITGESGSGKTHTALILAAKMRFSKGMATVYVDCKKLQSSSDVRMKDILDVLTEAFQKAIKMDSCTVILDDLDELAPNMDVTSAKGGNSTQHQQVNPSAVHQAKLISDHIRKLIKEFLTIGTLTNVAPTSKILLTCRHDRSIACALLSPRESFRWCTVPILSNIDRAHLFSQMLSTKIEQLPNSNCYETIDRSIKHHIQSFGKKIEAFRPRDLEILTARVQHILCTRPIASTNLYPWQCDKDSPCASQVTNAVHQALTTYIPTSLQSVGVEITESSGSWSEVGGLFQAKEELTETILRPVKYDALYKRAPIKLPRGVLLYGPPGCGKSYLIPSLAKECKFNLITCRGPELLDKYIGASEAKVRQLFVRAYAAAPSILFLDEFDALAPRRGSDHTGVTDRVVNQLLTFLDGVEGGGENTMYVIAATSRPDKVDPALLRPGRLSKHIFVGYPENSDEWHNLFRTIVASRNIDSEVKDAVSRSEMFDVVGNSARYMQCFTAADMKAVLDTAHLKAVHEYLSKWPDADEGREKLEPIALSLQNIVEAFKATKPSISRDDRVMLSQLYRPFMKCSGRNKNTASILGSGGIAVDSLGSFSGVLGSEQPAVGNIRLQTTLK